MSCSGCRVLRKGCSDSCVLRPSIVWIEAAEAQAHATVFVAKFFGRAGLLSSLSSVPESQCPVDFVLRGGIPRPMAPELGVSTANGLTRLEPGPITSSSTSKKKEKLISLGQCLTRRPKRRRTATPSDESAMTSELRRDEAQFDEEQTQLLDLFV
ncbi:uncharacterized protein A4U43_C07F29710 [Asparagus officinalis]|uniref:LOB domain-containing protein n=1 Tax=Asparagus officinalis TaxID=4686 RepID=A0A5P1EFU4_ASPOF|nr:uncharacterized protein A4U43_C07F29710 [Asparagus officinalis]